ncbi:Aminopeptidase 2 mitochondrial [Boothiomyces macroporosus]|uniref:Aminopeptidase n=1 Tax=Boothiomyces macroporosus TaxID=261099 RepID=A0AAD5Y7C1_9FUNG|nr:Aminopeptidase 2 mitochondrial [Boothiomyces macroporosus]
MTATRRLLPAYAKPTHYNLTLVPGLDTGKFTGQVSISLTVTETTKKLVANAKDLEVVKASAVVFRVNPGGLPRVNAWPKDPKTHRATQPAASITLDKEEETVTFEFEHEIPATSNIILHVEFNGTHFDDMKGFYRSSYLAEDGSKKYLVTTQFEAADARRAFPCWDEPNRKATFDVQLLVPQDLVALSNMNIVEEKDVEFGSKTFRSYKYATTPIMSSYLLAFCVGDFEYIEGVANPKAPADAEPITCRVYTLKGKKEQGRFALGVGIKTLEFFSEYFDIKYPLPKMDQIAIPDFSAGAMENWGLVTYRDVALLVDGDKTSIATRRRVAEVVCHEFAHQWFGNLVTMDWWKELWLNEGFATYVGIFAVDKNFPDWKTFDEFVGENMVMAFSLDGLRSSHPIEVEVNTPKDIDQIFDGISYAKGASVIRLISSYLGAETFMNGVRLYLKKFAYKNATTIDLWNACSEASGKDIAKIMKEWITDVGYPMVTITGEEYNSETKQLTLTLQQKRFLATGDLTEEEEANGSIWSIPVSVLTHNGVVSETFLFTEKAGQITFDYDLVDGAFWKLNSSCQSLIRINYSGEQLASISQALKSKPELFAVTDRLEILMDVFSFAEGGLIATTGALEILKGYSEETDLRRAWSADKKVVEGIDALLLSIFSSKVEQLGYDYPEGEDETVSSIRTLAIEVSVEAEDEKVKAELKERYLKFRNGDENAFHSNIRGLVFACGHAGSDSPQQDFDFLYNLYLTGANPGIKTAALTSLAKTNDITLAKKLLEEYVFDSDKVKPQDFFGPYLTLVMNPAPGLKAELTPYTKEWVFANWNLIYSKFESQAARLSYVPIIHIYANLSWEMIGFVEKWAAGEGLPEEEAQLRKKQVASFIRSLNQSLETLKSSATWVDREKDSVREWFVQNGFTTL